MKKSVIKRDMETLLAGEMRKVKGGADSPCWSCRSDCKTCYNVTKKSSR